MAPFSTMKPASPAARSALLAAPGLVWAMMTVTSAMPPLVMNCLVPLRTQSEPSRFAVVARPVTFDPAPGSVRPNAPVWGIFASLFGLQNGVSQRRRCSGVPMASMALAVSPLAEMWTAMPASPHESSSAMRQVMSLSVMPRPPSSAGK